MATEAGPMMQGGASKSGALVFCSSAGLILAGFALSEADVIGRGGLAVLLGVAMLIATFACGIKAVRTAGERVAWLAVAAGAAGWGISSIGYLVNTEAVTSFPSWADAAFLFYPAMVTGFVLLARNRLPGLPRARWLDAAIGGLALAAVVAAVVYEPMLTETEPDGAGDVALVYTLSDHALVGFLGVVCLYAGWRRGRVLYVLAGGAAITATGDALWAFGINSGKVAADPLPAVAWAGGVVLIASAAMVSEARGDRRGAPDWSLLAVPLIGALGALTVLATTTVDDSVAGLLATIVIVLAIGRLAMSLVDNRRASERERQEVERRRAVREAERASEAKTEFLSRMSHEVRTPLNSILGFAQLLVDDVDGDERQSVERILRAGNHLQRLIDDILDLSTIEAGETVVTLEPVDLTPIIDESVALLDPLARSTGSGVVRRDGYDAPAAVVADSQRLKQVLLNLISNALKYGGAESEVIVRVERDDGEARICVIDAGPGIPDEYLPKLFDPFERGPARGSGIEGSGLGLALTKNLVERMGGTIGLTTGPGGSTFWFKLPSADTVGEGKAAAPAEHSVSATSGKLTALYIEDHVSNVTLVERLLERRGDFELLTAMTGRAGLQLAASAAPDVVLLDLDLPDMRGDDVLVELRFDPATSSIPVIVVTADATTRRQEELLNAGAAAYVVKPIQLASFMATIDAVVGGRTTAG